jgi:hypothetical protein
MADHARVEAFHEAIWDLNEPRIRAVLAEDPNLIYKRIDNNDCMYTLFDRYFRVSGRSVPIEEIFRIMNLLFELGYKPTLNRFFSVKKLSSGNLHVVITNLFDLFLEAGIKGDHRQVLKKLLERMSDEELDYLDSFRFPIYSYTLSHERDKNKAGMEEISKIIAEIRKYKERFQNISHLSKMFSNANRGHMRASDAAGAGAGAGGAGGEGGAAAPASRLPPRSKLGKASGNVRNLIGSFLSGKKGTVNNQLSFLRTKLSRTEPALAAAGAGAAAGGAGGGAGAAAGGTGGAGGGAEAAAAANAALLSRPGPPNSQMINYYNNNQNGGRRRVSRKSRQSKSKTMRRRNHK